MRVALITSVFTLGLIAFGQPNAKNAPGIWRTTVATYCLDCHDADSKKGGIDLDAILDAEVGAHADVWERVVRQLQAGQMPPVDNDRPAAAERDQTAEALIKKLDAAAAKADAKPSGPHQGTAALRRLTRTQYGNAVRDVFGVEIDATELLPADEASHGFDNITVTDLSPALLDRYVSAAQKIARLATGAERSSPDARSVRVRADLTQDVHIDGLPIGTRGGILLAHHFPRAGTYEVRVLLARDRNEHIEGMHGTQQLEFLLDGQSKKSITLNRPKNQKEHTNYNRNLKASFEVEAGRHELGVTFAARAMALQESVRQPYDASFNYHRHPRRGPAVFQVTIVGPIEEEQQENGSPKLEPTRAAARKEIARLLRHATRRPTTDRDVQRIMAFYDEGRKESESHAGGMESAVAAILLSRGFLFHVETASDDKDQPATLTDLELASRLSFFLWSSVPDEELLQLAENNELHQPEVLAKQVRRMLADGRADALTSNFANQWLYLRNLASITPDARLHPDFDENLRQAMQRETELLFANIVAEDRSVLDLIRPGETWLNERLARHYGIPHVIGSRWRRVAMPMQSEGEPKSVERGGLLRQGSVLTVTSYATRTSPVLRGHWILENLLGTPPPPAPPDVPALEENKVAADLPMRERLAAHRQQKACAGCHHVIDPIGFCLEHFDAVGGWRERDAGQPVDVRGGLADGRTFAGVRGLEDALLARPEIFVRTLTEKLMTFALARGVEPADAPAIRTVIRQAAEEEYRFSDLMTAIVQSTPFRIK